ncbi:MAG: acetylglutamate kinase [Anaerolineae bacterium]|nr:acetylglutamate kinase [Anaerolineae bacterium]
MQLIKIGGNELDQPDFLAGLARQVAMMAGPVMIVHGGGKAIADLQTRLGIEPVKVDGLRVTDAQSLWLTQMVLSGHSNKLIVAALLKAGVKAIGLSGVDGGLLQCRQRVHPTADLGFVGEIVQVNPVVVQMVVAQGMVPVISPISVEIATGQVYNVNADDAAAALALALRVTQLIFISNVPGVLDPQGQLYPHLTPTQTETLIQQTIINGGMIPKTRAALDGVQKGIPQARITNLAGLLSGGTLFVREAESESVRGWG